MKIFKNVIVIVFAVLNMSVVPEIYAADLAGGSSEKLDAREAVEMGDNILNKIGLSEGQKKQLEANSIRDKKETRVLFTNMAGHRDALTTELMKPELDINKINQIQANIKATQNQLTDKRLNALIEIRKILTLEQFKKYRELTALRKDEKAKRARNERK